MSALICQWNDPSTEDEERREALLKRIEKMPFVRVYDVLKPALDSFRSPEFDEIPKINELRNSAAHATDTLIYNGRCLYSEHDALAELFFKSYAIGQELAEFVSKRINDPREFQRIGRNVYLGKKNPLEK